MVECNQEPASTLFIDRWYPVVGFIGLSHPVQQPAGLSPATRFLFPINVMNFQGRKALAEQLKEEHLKGFGYTRAASKCILRYSLFTHSQHTQMIGVIRGTHFYP